MSSKKGASPRVCRIGTRKSLLATTQCKQVQKLIERHGIQCELVLVESEGDMDRSTPLYDIETSAPGLFTKQLEQALLFDRIDLAVHSLKDLPTLQPPELKVACSPPRVIANDCLVVKADCFRDSYLSLGLREGAKIGTSSLRREAQLLSVRPDLNVSSIRGNVPTRIEAVRSGKVDAVVLAEAGLFRLGMDLGNLVKVALPPENFVPAPGQGALAVEVRTSVDEVLLAALSKIHDATTELETRIERKVLRELEGGCTLPLGVRCMKSETGLSIRAFLGILAEEKDLPANPKWKSFHRFDLDGSEEESLIESTVNYFKGIIHG